MSLSGPATQSKMTMSQKSLGESDGLRAANFASIVGHRLARSLSRYFLAVSTPPFTRKTLFFGRSELSTKHYSRLQTSANAFGYRCISLDGRHLIKYFCRATREVIYSWIFPSLMRVTTDSFTMMKYISESKPSWSTLSICSS